MSKLRNLQKLAGLCLPMNNAEFSVVLEIAERLTMGRAHYGPLDPHGGHDWLQEALEEACDQAVYLTAAKLERAKAVAS
ncbi:MAG: hypothetical protein KGL39_53680 [Patescibacteria group bacterium]|nr:hypothetical protein [Patescibacteria group bacterium]